MEHIARDEAFALLKKYNGYADKREELQELLDRIHDVDLRETKEKSEEA